MHSIPQQQSLFPALARVDVEDRFVATHCGQVVVAGTHHECMSYIHEHLDHWHVEHESEFARRNGAAYTARTLVAWAYAGDRFLWTQQRVFLDESFVDAQSGHSLYEFLDARTLDAARLFVNRIPVWTRVDGWYCDWQARVQTQLALIRASRTLKETSNV